MTYSTTKFQVTRLLKDAWLRMGQLKTWKITGGSTTTVINTAWAGIEDPIYEDDDGALIFGSVVVVEDAGGAGAAPEGEISRITDYDSASQTITMDALTTALAANDRVAIASPLFPYQDMLEIANTALTKLGEVYVPDTSITIVAGTNEYTLPAAIRQRPVRVRVQETNSVDNNWRKVQNWDVIPAAPGSNWTLVLPDLAQGYSVEVLYKGLHPRVNSYDDDLIETLHPELITCAVIAEALQWYNNTFGGNIPYFVQRENKALQDLEAALVKYPKQVFVEQVPGMPHWKTQNKYVPLTSDLRAEWQ